MRSFLKGCWWLQTNMLAFMEGQLCCHTASANVLIDSAISGLLVRAFLTSISARREPAIHIFKNEIVSNMCKPVYCLPPDCCCTMLQHGGVENATWLGHFLERDLGTSDEASHNWTGSLPLANGK